MLSVMMQNVITISVIMLSVVQLNVILPESFAANFKFCLESKFENTNPTIQ
jgi:hypothetical protein